MTPILSKVWALVGKNVRIVVLRRPFVTVWMALVLPVILTWFLGYAQNILTPTATFGIGSARPVRGLPDALEAASKLGRRKVLFIYDNSTTPAAGAGAGGSGNPDPDLDRDQDLDAAVGRVIDIVSAQVAAGGGDVFRLQSEAELPAECPTSLRGASRCYGAVIFRRPLLGQWNYTIRSDPALSTFRLNVNNWSDNDAEVYLLPFQSVLDQVIAQVAATGTKGGGGDPPNGTGTATATATAAQQFPFTDRSPQQRRDNIRRRYQDSVHDFAGVAFLTSVMFIVYHMTGFIATERETGMAQLVDSMMATRWPAAARHVAHHLSFSAVYLPGWVAGALLVRAWVFPNTGAAIMIWYHIMVGLSLASASILFASAFRRAQLSGVTAILSVILLGILAQSLTGPDTATVAILSAFFAPCNYVYFVRYLSRWQEEDLGANLGEAAPQSEVAFPGLVYFVLLAVQIVAYAVLGALVESALWSGANSGGRRTVGRGGSSTIDALGPAAVRLDGFTKVYQPSRTSRILALLRISGRKPIPVVAVGGLTLDAGRGQIVALLGANGSGKSTTLDCIAGMSRVTRGSITVDGTGGLGIAPQRNVLWDELTVEEHIDIFSRLKSPSRVARLEVNSLVDSVDLGLKRKALAKTLSGGQKRKLQLGMMLAGGSAVCCVDEVSSGLDPLSRRKIWDILLAERGRRTIILTTHFLDEADLLADHVAILSRGTLRAQGSSAELKNRLGGGYHIIVAAGVRVDTTVVNVEGVSRRSTLDGTEYAVPTSNLAAEVVRSLEAAGIRDYRFSGPTIEDVFLALAEEIGAEDKIEREGKEEAVTAESELKEEAGSGDQRDSAKSKRRHPSRRRSHPKEAQDASALGLTNGRRIGPLSQVAIMFRKRITVARRNWPIYLAAFLLPVAAAGLVTLFLKGQPAMGCAPSSGSSTVDATIYARASHYNLTVLFGPESREVEFADTVGRLPWLGEGLLKLNGGDSALVGTLDQFRAYIAANYSRVSVGVWAGDEPQFGWVADQSLDTPLQAQALMDSMLTGQNITADWAPFDVPWEPGTGKSLQVVVYTGIALAAYPAFFALYPSVERRRGVRALQYSNGVRPGPAWTAHLLFDYGIAVVASALAAGLWAGLSTIWWHVGYMAAVFLLYGLAAIPLCYLFSLFGRSQLSTYAYATAWQGIAMLVYLIAYLVTVTNSPVDRTDRLLAILTFTLSLLAPVISAMRAMMLALNLFSAACDGHQFSNRPGSTGRYGGPILYLVLQAAGYFAILILVDRGSLAALLRPRLRWVAALVWPWGRGRRGGTAAAPLPPPLAPNDDDDREAARPAQDGDDGGDDGDDGLRVKHVTKSFGKITAVDNVTFGVGHSQVFALLGPNGAGKSTTISLIRGDIRPDPGPAGGDVLVEQKSVARDPAAARAHLGVCPQADALDLMTAREHLEFYARIRGLAHSGNDVSRDVSVVLAAVGLEAHADRMADALSGGNRRKLSLGIALMGNPTVVLLDEPSSGLDAAAKRVMWQTLAAAVPGRSILLTTHSMEEASALADRVGILAGRMLAAGTPDALRRRFGDEVHVHLVSRTAPRTGPEEMVKVAQWVRATFGDAAAVEDKTYHGQMRFSVPASAVLSLPSAAAPESEPQPTETSSIYSSPSISPCSSPSQGPSSSAIGRLAVLLEENKDALGIEHYTVSPTTLDQVFLAIVGRHNVQEEGEHR